MSSQRSLIPLPRYLGLRWIAFLIAVAILAWMCAPSSRKLAKRLLAAGEARQAAVLLRNSLEVESDKYSRSEVHEELASVEILLGHPKEAIKNQEQSVDLAPDSIKGLARLAEYYDLFCQPEEASKALSRAMTLYRSWARDDRPEILDLTRGLEVLGPGDLPSLVLAPGRAHAGAHAVLRQPERNVPIGFAALIERGPGYERLLLQVESLRAVRGQAGKLC